ncbi:Rieske 2Fe-2S domain-containing protein [Cupriavidus necator]
MTTHYPRNCRYVAAMSHEVGRNLLDRTILNEPVLLYRREDGSVAVIENRCSHRRVSLSLGTLVGDHVQCGYHGLRFDGDGACVRIPAQDRIPPQACIRAYPVAERDGFVWIWPGQRDLADVRLVPDFSEVCSSPRFAGRRASTLPVQAPCLFNIENVLDLSHVSYAHEKTVGTPEVAETRPETEITDTYVEVRRTLERSGASPLYRRLFDWHEVRHTQSIRFWPGGNVRLNITIEPVGNTDPSQVRHLRVVGPCTPETDATHFKFSAMYRDFALDDVEVTATIAEQFHKTILEDKVLMEDQQRNWHADGDGVRMIDLAVDRAPLAARRMLRQLAEAERQ